MVEAPRLPGSIDLITCATRPPRGDPWRAAVPGGSGVGLEWDDALVATVGEAIERMAMVPDARALERTREGSYIGIGELALDPRRLNVFHDEAYGRPGFPRRPFSPEEVMRWCPARAVGEEVRTWVPAEYAYFSTDALPSHHWFPTTSGVASHRNRNAALLGALCELVERDAFVGAWLRGAPLPGVDPAGFRDTEIDEICRRAARAGVQLRLRDLRGALDVPIYLAIAETRGGGAPAFGLGAAAHPNGIQAAKKALLECVHTWNWAYLKIDRGGLLRRRDTLDAIPLGEFGDHVYLYAHPWAKVHAAFLFETAGWVEPRGDAPSLTHDDSETALGAIFECLRRDGHDVFEIDQTPDAMAEWGYFVVRALVPGFAPLQPGWRIQSLSSPRLPATPNPSPHPFP